jgi:predicted CopG family antitoxin
MMVNMTLSIPEDLYKEMMAHSELKWSDVARQAFEKKVKELHWMDEVLKNSKVTEEDAERIGHDVKARMRKRFSK